MKKVMKTAVIGLVGLFMLSGCSVAENNGGGQLPPDVFNDYVDTELVLGGWEVSVESAAGENLYVKRPMPTSFIPGVEPLIFPSDNGLLVQFYGNPNCRPSINTDYSGLGDLGTSHIIVGWGEDGQQLCGDYSTDTFIPFTFRIFVNGNRLTSELWQSFAENSSWANFTEYEADGNPQYVQSKPFVMADGVRLIQS